ncbi:MAG: hypothetical protein ACOY90_10650 [Candidatus Zhuqueibacterota bacterium]
MHIELVNRLKEIIPSKANVIILGDGEFDGSNLIRLIQQNGWSFVLRTSKNRILIEQDDPFSFRTICPLQREEYFWIPDVRFDQANSPKFDAIVWHRKEYNDPVYLLTNISLPDTFQIMLGRAVIPACFWRESPKILSNRCPKEAQSVILYKFNGSWTWHSGMTN